MRISRVCCNKKPLRVFERGREKAEEFNGGFNKSMRVLSLVAVLRFY